MYNGHRKSSCVLIQRKNAQKPYDRYSSSSSKWVPTLHASRATDWRVSTTTCRDATSDASRNAATNTEPHAWQFTTLSARSRRLSTPYARYLAELPTNETSYAWLSRYTWISGDGSPLPREHAAIQSGTDAHAWHRLTRPTRLLAWRSRYGITRV